MKKWGCPRMVEFQDSRTLFSFQHNRPHTRTPHTFILSHLLPFSRNRRNSHHYPLPFLPRSSSPNQPPIREVNSPNISNPRKQQFKQVVYPKASPPRPLPLPSSPPTPTPTFLPLHPHPLLPIPHRPHPAQRTILGANPHDHSSPLHPIHARLVGFELEDRAGG